MVKIEEDKRQTNKKLPFKFNKSLILTINQNEKIIKFNNICEQVSGYKKEEILNKKICEFLLPDRYSYNWNNFINLKNKMIDNLKLPLCTKNGHEIMVSWATFPIKNNEKQVTEINFVGNIISDDLS